MPNFGSFPQAMEITSLIHETESLKNCKAIIIILVINIIINFEQILLAHLHKYNAIAIKT
jgi:hypothetical protein